MALAGLGRAVAIAGEPGRPVRAKARDADGDKDSYSPPVSSAPSAPIQVRPPLLRTFSGLRMGGRLCLGVRPPGLKPAEEPGKRSAEQYNPAWLLLRDHLPTCSRPLFGPRANPHPKTPRSSSEASWGPLPRASRTTLPTAYPGFCSMSLPLSLSPEPKARRWWTGVWSLGGPPMKGRNCGAPSPPFQGNHAHP